MHATLLKFGYPASLIRDYRHWSVLLRPVQPTLGALVLACRGKATSFAAIGDDAALEMHECIRDIEATLGKLFGCDRINYLMLMMVDPHVHVHVLPRHATPRQHEGRLYDDPAWPGPPDLAHRLALDEAAWNALLVRLRHAWPVGKPESAA